MSESNHFVHFAFFTICHIVKMRQFLHIALISPLDQGFTASWLPALTLLNSTGGTKKELGYEWYH